VLLASGIAVPISQLKAGMKVLATNTKTGKTQAETVTAVLVHHDTDLYDLKVKDGGKTAVIDTTSSHLFWVPGAGGHGGRWVRAGALRYGTRLRTPSGRDTAVVTGGWVPRQSSGWMWDLTVPGNNDHDFYIDTTAAPVIVHNRGSTVVLMWAPWPRDSATRRPVPPPKPGASTVTEGAHAWVRVAEIDALDANVSITAAQQPTGLRGLPVALASRSAALAWDLRRPRIARRVGGLIRG
jgi:hypothetical protein